jgi:hypothetical protein
MGSTKLLARPANSTLHAAAPCAKKAREEGCSLVNGIVLKAREEGCSPVNGIVLLSAQPHVMPARLAGNAAAMPRVSPNNLEPVGFTLNLSDFTPIN